MVRHVLRHESLLETTMKSDIEEYIERREPRTRHMVQIIKVINNKNY